MERKKNVVMLVILVLGISGCTTFQGQIPITGPEDTVYYLSPGVPDGIQDEIIIPVEMPKITGLKITSYSFNVLNNYGDNVFSLNDSITARERKNSTRVRELPLPESFRWSGRDSESNIVPDGEYSVFIEAADGKGNEGSFGPIPVIVDNLIPAADITLPYSIISPDSDGKQDSVTIRHRNATYEEEWTGIITDETGSPVNRYSWSGIPEDILWDGKNDSGTILPEGNYSYSLSASDKAGNKFTTKLAALTIDNSKSPIDIVPDRTIFSPNGDGIYDEINIIPIIPANTVVGEYEMVLFDLTGTEVRAYKGKTLPGSFVFDGRNQSGVLLTDGTYFARLSVVFPNGSTPQAVSSPIILDTLPPSAVITAAYNLFSPNGDGNKDTVEILLSSSSEGKWYGSIINSAGKTVNSHTWHTRLLPFIWDGTDETGTILPNGTYSFAVECEDAAGNKSRTVLRGISIDNRSTPVRLSANHLSFSPNGDGLFDSILFNPTVGLQEGIQSWRFTIKDTAGAVAWEITEETGVLSRGIPGSVTWAGENMDGKVVDGEYTAWMTVTYLKGDVSAAVQEGNVIIDTQGPEINLQMQGLPFSPDSDGENDVLTINPNVSDNSGLMGWTMNILDSRGNQFYRQTATGAVPRSITWDGKSRTGELVQSADDYAVIFSAVDTLGNSSVSHSVLPVDILVLREGNRLRIVISSIYFKPYTADYIDVGAELAEKNLMTITRLGEVLKKFPNYSIRLEGHAVREYWDTSKWLDEEKNELTPLSEERAAVIREALIIQGIDGKRMTTRGYGGYQPVIPHSDLQNRWKNRRVEFILVK